MANTSSPLSPSSLVTTLGVTAFAKAYSQVETDATGCKSIRKIATVAGSTYLAAAEVARDLCYRERAALTGTMSDTYVRLV